MTGSRRATRRRANSAYRAAGGWRCDMGCGGGGAGGPTGGLHRAKRATNSGTPVKVVYPHDPAESERPRRISGLVRGICVLTGFAIIWSAGESAWVLLAFVLLFVGLIAGMVCGGEIVERRSHRVSTGSTRG